MTDKEANEMRCVANEIILQLYEAGQAVQLGILKAQLDRAVSKPKQRQSKGASHAAK